MKRSDYLRQKRAQNGKRRGRSNYLLIAFLGAVFLLILYRFPPVYNRLSWRIDALRTKIVYAINPPEEAVFRPEQQDLIDQSAQATLEAISAPSATPDILTPTPSEDRTPEPSLVPTLAPTPLPDQVELENVVYVDQHGGWNYCGPANLTMALKYWGWKGSRDIVIREVKPGRNEPNLEFWQRGDTDKNVMPYEMADFVTGHTEYNVVVRYGGDNDLLKRLIANGFAVVIEKGYYEFSQISNSVAWMGHYLFVTGYDEIQESFIVQDAYLTPGEDLYVDYPDFTDGWRSFNYLFMVVYPPNRESEVYEILGPWADNDWANRHALDIANEEITNQTGINQFFAWFNKGTSHVQVLEYVDAAFAYDYAFLLYEGLPDDDTIRPYRIMWYQTGPYWAYYYSYRYQDMINLVNDFTFETVDENSLEESLYWRGRALLELGYVDAAIEDFKLSVYYNKNFAAGWEMLTQLGVSP